MRLLSQVLRDLIVLGEQVVARPLAMVAIDRLATYRALAVEVQQHDTLPAEDDRATRGACALVIAIGEHWRALDASDEMLASMWLMLAGGALPIVRHEFSTAYSNERQGGRT